jgi:hypothetical protein
VIHRRSRTVTHHIGSQRRGVPYRRACSSTRTGGGAGVEEEGRDGSGASHHYGAIGDQALCVVFYFSSMRVNVGSRVHYIDVNGGTHCPLIEGIAPDQGRELDLVPCGPSPLEINSNKRILKAKIQQPSS